MSDLTIVIPTIGRGTLPRAIQSVLRQSLKTDLVVVWDTDRDGAGPTMNRGIAAVKSDFVGFLADDDTIDPRYHAWFLRDNVDADLFIFTMRYSDGRVLPTTQNAGSLQLGGVGGSYIVRTEVARRFPFVTERVNEGYHEDWEMIRQIREAGLKIIVSTDVAYFVRH